MLAEEEKEPWLNYLALTTVIFAILLSSIAALMKQQGAGRTRTTVSGPLF